MEPTDQGGGEEMELAIETGKTPISKRLNPNEAKGGTRLNGEPGLELVHDEALFESEP